VWRGGGSAGWERMVTHVRHVTEMVVSTAVAHVLPAPSSQYMLFTVGVEAQVSNQGRGHGLLGRGGGGKAGWRGGVSKR
jgi:hypothetical protein